MRSWNLCGILRTALFMIQKVLTDGNGRREWLFTEYINIMITGHQHSMFTYLQERLTDADITEKAKAFTDKAGKKAKEVGDNIWDRVKSWFD